MGAGGLREPRRKGTRVAAPSGCIVPWAARASCWPQPQQLLPVSATGSGRRCCTGAFLPAGLFGGSMLFESTRLASGKVITKQKLQYPVRILEFLVGAGGCREPRRKGARVAAPSGCIVPWAARASCWPQPQQLLPVSAAGSGRRCCTGAFPRRTIRRVDAVRIHPCSPFSRQIKQKLQYPVRILESLVGAGGLREPRC